MKIERLEELCCRFLSIEESLEAYERTSLFELHEKGQEMSRGGGDSSWGSYRVKLRFCRVNLSVNLWSRSGGKTSMMGSAEVCSVV